MTKNKCRMRPEGHYSSFIILTPKKEHFTLVCYTDNQINVYGELIELKILTLNAMCTTVQFFFLDISLSTTLTSGLLS